MADFSDQMMNFVNNTERKIIPDQETQKAMTKAGAKVFEDALRKAAPRSSRKNEKYGHLQDQIMSQNTDIDGEENGNSVVGFGQKAYIARFLNDGTIKMKATHWVDNTRRDTTDEVLKAEQEAYNKRMRGDQ